MRFTALLAAAAIATPVMAQVTVRTPNNVMVRRLDTPRVGIGVTTTSGSTTRDTLGVLVASVRPGSPAEKAGIEEGNRIASINGVSLKLAAADVGDPEMANAMSRRLTRELEKLKAGDDVDLRVYSGGQTRSIKVKTVAPTELAADVRRPFEDRATLGIDIGLTGSSRDTLGVFVMGVDDAGPAAKAGIEEGTRIVSINGADLRSKRSADEEPMVVRATSVSRLEREMAKVKAGDDVDLRLYYNGQFRNVKVKTVRAGDLPHSSRVRIMTSDNSLMPAMPPLPDRIDIRVPELNERLRRATDEMRVALPRMMMGFGNRVVW